MSNRMRVFLRTNQDITLISNNIWIRKNQNLKQWILRAWLEGDMSPEGFQQWKVSSTSLPTLLWSTLPTTPHPQHHRVPHEGSVFFDNLFTLENRSYVHSSCTSTDDLKQWYLIWKVRTLKRFRTLRFASWGRSFPKAFPEWVTSSSSSRAENPPKTLVHRIYGTGIYIIYISLQKSTFHVGKYTVRFMDSVSWRRTETLLSLTAKVVLWTFVIFKMKRCRREPPVFGSP